MSRIKLRARSSPSANWVENFSKLGWKVRDGGNSKWIQLAPHNTKIRSADNTSWLSVE